MDSHLDPTDSRFEKNEKAAYLAQCPLFSGLSQWELKSISQLMRLVEFKKDEVVYREGDAGDRFFVVVSGRFEACAESFEKKSVLAYLRRGDHFGEMSLLTDQPHSATIRALSDSLVLELKKNDFNKTVENNATVSLQLSRRLSNRIKAGQSPQRALAKNDIISVLNYQPRSHRTSFAINLAASLHQETHQKTILLDLSPNGYAGSRRVPLDRFTVLEMNPTHLSSEYIERHPSGFDRLSIQYKDKAASHENTIPMILNGLTLDYRFIVIDLSAAMDEMVFKAITQSDSIYFVTDSSMTSISEAQETLKEIEKNNSFPEEKISVVINEAFLGVRTNTIMRKELFGKKICFSLPTSPSTNPDFEEKMIPCVIDQPDTEYARAIRHIARYVSGNLVGLVLGSGAALGLAHIGVLRVLEREKIPIDMIAGSSIGALIGSMYACGKTAQEIEEAASEIHNKALLGRLIDFTFPIKGLVRGRKIMKHFRSHIGDITFDHCKIPLRVTGANLSTRQTYVYDSGLVWEAVRVSISIPAIFKPIIKNGDVMVDGGILSPLPIHCLRQAGVNKIIAVNVFPSYQDILEKRIIREEALEKEAMLMRQKNVVTRFLYRCKKYLVRQFSNNVFDVLMNTIQSMESEIADMESQSADLLIRPVIADSNWVQFYKPQAFIKKGEEETMKHLPKIKELVLKQNI